MTEHPVSPTRRAGARHGARTATVTPLTKAPNVARRVFTSLRAAGSFRAWTCLILTAYVLGVAILNLARYGLER